MNRSSVFLSLGKNIQRVTEHGDILLAFLLMAVITIMILPLPTMVVDGLLALNLAISISMLMLSTYIPSALSFSVFPAMLLFTTLFRLALNVTTTRLILLHANAGEIINTFGNFVVGGNFIVGGVVFLILTIVQFMVIAKGSERVAEVGARFTLDAMPGKQMSIDADLRAGNIEMEDAQRRRNEVTQESQLFGAMDGAMKFVKGDAIAGLIITAVNLFGGIAIGMFQKDMVFRQALQTYSILTIGDGLVSQIPSMLISITAGIVVTRVAKDDSGPLGIEIGKQFFAQPRALMVASLFILLFALVPGFPKMQFLGLGSLALVIAYTISRQKRQVETPESRETERMQAVMSATGEKKPAPARDKEAFSITVPLLVDISESVRRDISARELNDEVVRLRHALYNEMGVPFPGISLRFVEHLPENSYCILLQEVPMSNGRLRKNHVLVREQSRNLSMMGFTFEEDEAFVPGVPSLWMQTSETPKLDKAGMTYLTPTQVLIFHLSTVLKRNAGEFIGIQETRYLLTQMEGRFGELVREALRVMPVQRVADILQRLVQEQISVRNLRKILETLIEWGPKEKSNVLLTEYVRIALKRQISYQYSAGMNMLPAYILDTAVEETMRGAIRQASAGSYLALPPDTTARILHNIRREVRDVSARAVVLVSMDLRRYMRKLIEQEFQETAVLSYQELTPEITIQPLGRITL